MSEVYDDLNRHLEAAPDLTQASVPMGMLLAWCARHHLLSEAVCREQENLLLRIRVEEARGSELVVACGGALTRDMFTPVGQAFLDRYYAGYLQEFAACFDMDPYAVEDSWENYRKIAKRISAAYHGRGSSDSVLTRLQRGWRRLRGDAPREVS